jgi:dTDP-4-dehydrorhamnose reductase
MRVLILGATGMIGSALFRVMHEKSELEVIGLVRDNSAKLFFPANFRDSIVCGDPLRSEALLELIVKISPDVVINSIGITKHRPESSDPALSIGVNSLFPHQLAKYCSLINARLIHVSTDCIFSGAKGGYLEHDVSDAQDIYGKTKALGEIDYPNAITLRTSTIGHEFQTKYGLLEWFLSQKNQCRGFSRAIFSGMTNIEFSRVIRDFVMPNVNLSGIYNVAGIAINKYELLKIISSQYGRDIQITEDRSFEINRTLNAERFGLATGYKAPEWCELIREMHYYNLQGE